MGFTKLDAEIVTSSIWAESSDTLRVWIYLLAKMDQFSEVHVTIPAMAMQCGLKVEEVKAIIDKFSLPDPDSRSQDFEGRRIEIIRDPEFIIKVLNGQKYRARDYTNAERQQRYRDRHRNVTVTEDNSEVTGCNTRQKAEDRSQKTEARDDGVPSVPLSVSSEVLSGESLETEEESEEEQKTTRRAKFVPPTLEEVQEYVSEKGYTFDPENFWAHWDNRDWRFDDGKGAKMKNWHLACVTFQKNQRSFGETPLLGTVKKVEILCADCREPMTKDDLMESGRLCRACRLDHGV